MFNLSLLLEDTVRNYPQHAAIVFGDQRWTYTELDGYANRVANLLVASGVRPGDRVALSCPNLPAFPAIYFGAVKAGAVIVPMNAQLKRREMAYYLIDSAATAFFCFAGTSELPTGEEGLAAFDQAPACERFFVIGGELDGAESFNAALEGHSSVFDTVQRQEADPAMILYTSGTTGQPKGAMLSHANLVLNAEALNKAFNNAPLQDTHLVVLPLFHSFAAMVHMLAGLACASTLVLLPRFDAATVLQVLQTQPITFFAGVPTMYWSLINALTDQVHVEAIARDLRLAVVAGSSLPLSIIEGVKEQFGVTIVEGYGLSEASPGVAFTKLGCPPRPGSIGLPIWGVEMRLIDGDGKTIEGADTVGEIAVRGHNVMIGYHNRPEATAETIREGWLRTGDLGRRDADGWYYIVDRIKDLIIRGGYNVYPREIEEVLMRHEAVALAAVVGVPDPRHGEEVKAFLVLKPNATVTEADLVTWSRGQMAAYKYPRIVTFVDEIPLGPTGKPLKQNLR